MTRSLTTLAMTCLIALSAATLPALDHRVVTADNFPIGDPILLSADDGIHHYSVTGHYDNPGWGFVLNVSEDGGWTWTETYNNYQGQDHFHFDAVFGNGSVYVARIDSWDGASGEEYELLVQRFDIDGVRDATFGGTGTVSISGQTTSVLADVSLIANAGYLEVFWIKDSTLQHSYFSISGGSTQVTHSSLPATTAIGSLDAVAMSGQTTSFFAAFKDGSGELKGWRWKSGVGSATIDITPDEDLFPEWEAITVSSYGDRVSVVTANPYDSNPTKVFEMWSDDDGISWNQDLLALGWDGVGIHMWDPTVVVGSDQTVVTFSVKDDSMSTEKFGWVERQHGEHWSPSPIIFTHDTDWVGSTMGMCWSPEGGFMASYFSKNPIANLVYFVKMPQLMRTGFEDGDLGQWSSVSGN